MDLITRYDRTKKRAAFRLNSDLTRFELRLHRKEIEAGFGSAFFGSERIRDVLPQHLISAADTQNPRAALQRFDQQLFKPAIDEPSQIRDRVFRAGNNDEIRRGCHLGPSQILQCHTGDTLKRIEICVIGNVRQTDHTHSECPRHDSMIFQRYAVLLINAQGFDVRQDTEARPARLFFQELWPAREQPQVASKAIDDESTNTVLLLIIEKGECAHNGSKHAATINIRNEHRPRSNGSAKRQIHDVAIFEIDFRCAARAFQNDDIELRCEPMKAFESLLQKERFSFVIFGGRERAIDTAVQHDLNVPVAGRLQQNRIHVGLGLDACGLGLRHLSPAYFAAIGTDVGI